MTLEHIDVITRLGRTTRMQVLRSAGAVWVWEMRFMQERENSHVESIDYVTTVGSKFLLIRVFRGVLGKVVPTTIGRKINATNPRPLKF